MYRSTRETHVGEKGKGRRGSRVRPQLRQQRLERRRQRAARHIFFWWGHWQVMLFCSVLRREDIQRRSGDPAPLVSLCSRAGEKVAQVGEGGEDLDHISGRTSHFGDGRAVDVGHRVTRLPRVPAQPRESATRRPRSSLCSGSPAF
jgi:hypothetical protein